MRTRFLLRKSGIRRPELRSLCRRMTTFLDWSREFEAAANTCLEAGDSGGAVMRLHWAQYVLGPGDSKLRLGARMADAYSSRVDMPPPRNVATSWLGFEAEGLLQVPEDASEPSPLIVIVPGLFDVKERNHSLAMQLLGRGYAVLRCQLNPASTEADPLGFLEVLPRLVHEAVRDDSRIDTSRVHIYGYCLGGFFALHIAARLSVASITTVSAVCDVTTYTERLPDSALPALLGAGFFDRYSDPLEAIRVGSVDRLYRQISCPGLLFHGALDTFVPVSEMERVASQFAGDVEPTPFAFQGHGCAGKLGEIRARLLDFADRAQPTSTPWSYEPDPTLAVAAAQLTPRSSLDQAA